MDRHQPQYALDQERQVRSLTMYTTVVVIATLLSLGVLLLPRSSESGGNTGLAQVGEIKGMTADESGSEDERDELKRKLSEIERARDLGEMCLGKCNCLCYSRRIGDTIEPLTVCRLNQDACLALESKVRDKSPDSSSGRAVGKSVSVSCRQVDLREIDRNNGVKRHEWSPSKRNGGELFGIFYAGKCLLD